jgi:TetR/AcrR family transcriptional regulator, transcriptional repressor for nem operon
MNEPTMTAPDTRKQIVELASEFVQAVGYNAFSFRDLAERVGIRTASIHYHFPSKADLGREIVRQHRSDNGEFFARLDRSGGTAFERLQSYCDAFRNSYGKGNRICIGGMMATDSESLPPDVLEEVRGCYGDHEKWLAGTLKEGLRKGEVRFSESPAIVARVIFDALEGAMLATRAFQTPQRLVNTIKWCLSQIQPRP